MRQVFYEVVQQFVNDRRPDETVCRLTSCDDQLGRVRCLPPLLCYFVAGGNAAITTAAWMRRRSHHPRYVAIRVYKDEVSLSK